MRFPLLLATAFALAACAAEPEPAAVDPAPIDPAPAPAPALPAGTTVQIEPLGGSGVSGTVTLSPAPGGLEVRYELAGLTPGPHGFHVHENGSCADGDDGTPGGAAGGHFAPGGSPHGAPDAADGQRHAGDFGNVMADASGMASGSFVDVVATLDGPNGIAGKAVVVHADPDDLQTQPTGNAGSRVGCGVIPATAATGAAVGDTTMSTMR